MRKDSLKALFFVIGVLVVFLSAGIYISHLFKKFTIEFFDDDFSDEDLFPDEDKVVEPIVVCVEHDAETEEPQNI